MRLALLGPPGAGKGTQAEMLARDENFEHISTGDMIRDEMRADSDLGRFAKQFYDRGDLVPDDVVIEMIKSRLADAPRVILDGFPRTVTQAAALDDQLAVAGTPLDRVIYFDVNIDEVVSRLENRREVEGRADDEPEAMRQRLEVYRRQTEPVVDYYREANRLFEIDGIGGISEIRDRLRAAIA